MSREKFNPRSSRMCRIKNSAESHEDGKKVEGGQWVIGSSRGSKKGYRWAKYENCASYGRNKKLCTIFQGSNRGKKDAGVQVNKA